MLLSLRVAPPPEALGEPDPVPAPAPAAAVMLTDAEAQAEDEGGAVDLGVADPLTDTARGVGVVGPLGVVAPEESEVTDPRGVCEALPPELPVAPPPPLAVGAAGLIVPPPTVEAVASGESVPVADSESGWEAEAPTLPLPCELLDAEALGVLEVLKRELRLFNAEAVAVRADESLPCEDRVGITLLLTASLPLARKVAVDARDAGALNVWGAGLEDNSGDIVPVAPLCVGCEVPLGAAPLALRAPLKDGGPLKETAALRETDRDTDAVGVSGALREALFTGVGEAEKCGEALPPPAMETEARAVSVAAAVGAPEAVPSPPGENEAQADARGVDVCVRDTMGDTEEERRGLSETLAEREGSGELEVAADAPVPWPLALVQGLIEGEPRGDSEGRGERELEGHPVAVTLTCVLRLAASGEEDGEPVGSARLAERGPLTEGDREDDTLPLAAPEALWEVDVEAQPLTEFEACPVRLAEGVDSCVALLRCDPVAPTGGEPDALPEVAGDKVDGADCESIPLLDGSPLGVGCPVVEAKAGVTDATGVRDAGPAEPVASSGEAVPG